MPADQPEPRIAPLPPEELGPDAMAIIAGVMHAQSLPDVSEGPEFIATMVRHRELFQRQADYSQNALRVRLMPRSQGMAAR